MSSQSQRSRRKGVLANDAASIFGKIMGSRARNSAYRKQ
jgi:hypothetical protein